MNVFAVWLRACLKNVKQLCFKGAGTFCKTKSVRKEEFSKGAAVNGNSYSWNPLKDEFPLWLLIDSIPLQWAFLFVCLVNILAAIRILSL